MTAKVGLKLLQANLQHARAATSVLSRAFQRDGIDIALIQEPWNANTGRVSGLGTTSAKVIEPPPGTNPRVCLLIRRDINYFLLSDLCDRDTIAVHVIQPGGAEAVICSAYFPGDAEEQPPPQMVQNIVAHCRRKNVQLVMGCDANAHHVAWGSTNNNSRGESLLNYLLGEGMVINNLGSEPTFVNKNRKEVLDLTISSNYISNKVGNWRVTDEPSCSDHRHIRFDLDTGNRHIVEYRNVRGTDWNGYKTSIQANLLSCSKTISNHDQLEFAADQLSDAIILAYHENCPLRAKKDSRDTPWWNNNLNKMRAEVRRLYNRAKYSGGWEQYREALTTYNKAIRKAKTESWRRFCEGLNDTPSSARNHKILSKEREQELGSIKRPDGTFTQTRRETLEILAQAHFPGSAIIQGQFDSNPGNEIKRPHKENWQFAKSIITPDAIRGAIGSFKPFKSPGVDGVYPALLQVGLEALLPYLITLFRASIAWKHIPTCWKMTRVIYIPKAGRSTPEPKSLRPISLTSFLLKSMEKVVDEYIRRVALSRSPLSTHQYAYQAGKSTDLALNNLVASIGETLKKKEVAVAAFLDIEGAFNNALPKSLYESAAARGVNPLVCDWIKAMLGDRMITTSLQGETVKFRAARGCPQGGVLSPLLWSLLVDDLLAIIQLWEVEVQAYADDLVLLIKGDNNTTISLVLQEVLNTIMNWCEREEMSINPQKMVIVPFTKKRKLNGLRPPTLKGETVPFAREAKYLGVTLDKTLNWNSHLEKIIKKSTLSLWNCRRICGKSWGTNPKQMLWLYTEVIRPMITYGSVAWWSKTTQRTAQAKLSGLQRQACLLITGALRTTPTAAMEVLLGITPLHIHLQSEATKTTYRLYHSTNGTLAINNIRMEQTELLDEILNHSTLAMPSDLMPKTTSYTKPYSVTIPDRKEWEQSRMELEKADICMYTDGSKMPSGVGAGIYGRKPRTEITISRGKLSSIFQAEVHAIETCARMLDERQLKHRNIKIFSDSQAALKALESITCTSKAIWSCKEALGSLGGKNKISLIWIPSHTGYEGNEEADNLAKAGAEYNPVGPEPVLGIAYNTAKHTIVIREKEKSKRYWERLPGLNHSKAFIPDMTKKVTDTIRELGRKHLKALMGMYTGHCRLRHHMYRIGLAESAECRLCMEEDETAEHILCSCPAVERIRHSTLGNALPRAEDIKRASPSQIIELLRRSGLLGEI